MQTRLSVFEDTVGFRLLPSISGPPYGLWRLLMTVTVCLLVSAALEYRIRKALKDHRGFRGAEKGTRPKVPRPLRLPCFLGIRLLRLSGIGTFVLNLDAQHLHLLRLLGFG